MRIREVFRAFLCHAICFLKLHTMQLVVKTFLLQQLLMRTHFPDLAFIQHHDLAGFADGA